MMHERLKWSRKELLTDETVTLSVDVDNELRILRIVFHLLPQHGDMYIHGPACRFAAIAPDLDKQFVSRDHLAAPFDQISQQGEFALRHRESLIRAEDVAPFQVDLHVAELEPITGSVLHCEAAEYSLHPGQQFVRIERFCEVVTCPQPHSPHLVRGPGAGGQHYYC